jgi:hypothetical protein
MARLEKSAAIRTGAGAARGAATAMLASASINPKDCLIAACVITYPGVRPRIYTFEPTRLYEMR